MRAFGSTGSISGSIRAWQWLHRWSSLICTVFLLLICITGLPLIFHEEIDGWLNPKVYAALPSDAPRADLDRLVAKARGIYPGLVPFTIFVDDDEPQIVVSLAPSGAAAQPDRNSIRFVKFDARTGEVLDRSKPPGQQRQTFLGLMLHIHTDLFAGLSGELFLAAMASMFITAIVSGVVLYGPFMRKFGFGSIRAQRSRRVRWLDLHNLLGVVTLAWALIVGATGAMNELTKPLFALWQNTDVAAMVAPWKGKPPPSYDALSSPEVAYRTASRTLPNMNVISVVYPGGPLGSPNHYLLFALGKTPLTERLEAPVLVDARTGRLTAVVRMPWYLRALEVSRPLHFGDYGGLPLKILWALLDLVTIVVLGSGLYLWIVRPRREQTAAARQALHGASPAMEPAE